MVELLKTAVGSALKTGVGAGVKGIGTPLAGGETRSFADALGDLVESVEDSSAESNKAVTQMVDGSGDVHDAMIAMQRAEMTLHLTLQVRNKLMTAYHDVMKMPV
jgi:flagellar hook-basal body complex protein FliE